MQNVKLGFMGEATAMGDTVWGGGFGAEFFVFEREAYLVRRAKKTEKTSKKYNRLGRKP